MWYTERDTKKGKDPGRFLLFGLTEDKNYFEESFSFGRAHTSQTFQRQVINYKNEMKLLLSSPLVSLIKRVEPKKGQCPEFCLDVSGKRCMSKCL